MEHRGNYTITPALIEDPYTGEQRLSIEHAEVRSSDGRENVHRHLNETHQENFVYDEEDETYNYEQEADEDDVAVLVEGVGGEERYNEMVDWAFHNLSEQDIDNFDEIMEDGDLTDIAHALGELEMAYNNRSEDFEEYTETEEWFFEEILSPQDFEEVAHFVRETFSDEEVDTFNDIMNSNDQELIERLIDEVLEAYNEEIEDDEY